MYRNTVLMANRTGIQSWRTVLFAVAYFISLIRAESTSTNAQCVPTPISIPIGNVSIANGPPNGIARGIAISVGTPGQPFAFMPSLFNDTFVYDDTNLCAVPAQTFAQDSCITVRGGAYNAIKSTTQNPGFDTSAVNSAPYPDTSRYSDLFTLNDKIRVSNFTFGVPLNDWGEQFYTPQAMLGLGSNSTILHTLKEQNMVASRSWSFYWGKNGRGQQSNGSIVFGGYDRNRVRGTSNYTGKLNYTRCAWGVAVEIDTLSLIFLDASTKDLYNATSDTNVSRPLYGCLNPGSVGVASVMPYNNYFANFVIDTNYDSFNENGFGGGSIRSSGYNFYNLLYLEGDKPFLGDLNVTIKDGPSVRVKNDQLVVPHVYMDESSHTWKENGSVSDLRINPVGQVGEFSPFPLDLGCNFLTFVYMMINLDAGEFTLWPAYSDATTEDLVAVDEQNNVLQKSSTVCTGSAPKSAPSGNPPPAPPAESPTSTSLPSSGLSPGVIAAISIAGAVGVMLFLVGAWVFIRHRRKQKSHVGVVASGPEVQPIYTDKPNELSAHNGNDTTGWLPAANENLQGRSYELSGKQSPRRYEVEG